MESVTFQAPQDANLRSARFSVLVQAVLRVRSLVWLGPHPGARSRGCCQLRLKHAAQPPYGALVQMPSG